MLERSHKYFGWNPQLPDHRDFKLRPPAAIAARPPSIDLSVLPAMPKVYDQGELGSCVGHSVAAAFEYCVTSHFKTERPAWPPSRLFIYFNARKIEGTTQSDSGAQIRDGIKGVAHWGAPPEKFWPYKIDRFAYIPTDNVYKTHALPHRLSEYLAVEQSVDAICGALANKEPVVFGFSVYSEFDSNHMSDTGVLNMPGPKERLLGGHSTLIVGYDDSVKRFKVRNSWGEQWGQSGYYTMPYEYVADRQLASDFWVIRGVK